MAETRLTPEEIESNKKVARDMVIGWLNPTPEPMAPQMPNRLPKLANFLESRSRVRRPSLAETPELPELPPTTGEMP